MTFVQKTNEILTMNTFVVTKMKAGERGALHKDIAVLLILENNSFLQRHT